jgi:membrane fusion protein, multidrug efflux system
VKTDRIDRSYVAMPTQQRPPLWRRLRIGVTVLLAMAAAFGFAFPQYLPSSVTRLMPQKSARQAPRGDDPVPVLAAIAEKTDVPVYFDGVGASRALNTVTISAQVDGKLNSVNFKEGQDVPAGFVLAEIDDRVYQAQYDQAVAKKAQDEAQLANARLDLERYARLALTNSATRQQYDTQKALVAQLEAQVQVDQGAIDNAKAILSYTKIVAPLAGRTGIRQVDPGNIVHASDTTGIVVLTQIQPIAVIFTLPQQQLGQVNHAFGRGPLSVDALGDDNRTVIDRGTLVVIDNQVDPTTGTVKLKAEFPNADLQMWPGQFVNVKLLVDTLRQVVTVPSAAVQRGPNGTFVYVTQDDNTVAVDPVTVAQQDETKAVIADGLDGGERVVTSGFAQLTDGTRITIGTPENFNRPAGSERRRRPPRPTPAVASDSPNSSANQKAADQVGASPAGQGNASTGASQSGTAPAPVSPVLSSPAPAATPSARPSLAVSSSAAETPTAPPTGAGVRGTAAVNDSAAPQRREGSGSDTPRAERRTQSNGSTATP